MIYKIKCVFLPKLYINLNKIILNFVKLNLHFTKKTNSNT